MATKSRNKVTNHVRVELRVYNDYDNKIQFWLEPWGEFWDMEPKIFFNIIAKGPDIPNLEILYRKDCIIVVGWSGSVLWIYDKNGVELGGYTEERHRIPSPALEL